MELDTQQPDEVEPTITQRDFRYVRTFLEVLGQRSFSRAADVLHLTQQAVSGHVKVLEDDLGGVLFHRTTRSVSPTEFGATFAAAVEPLLADIDYLWRTTRSRASTTGATVHIGITAAAGHEAAPELIDAITARYPQLVADVVQARTDGVIDALRSGRIDIALVLMPTDLVGMHGWPIVRGTLAALLPREHPLALRASLATGDLEGSTLVLPRESSSPGVIRAAGDLARRERLKTLAEPLTGTAVPRMIFDGEAVGMWPTVIPPRFIPAGLVAVPFDDPPEPVDLWILLADGEPAPYVAAIVDVAHQCWPTSTVGR